MSFTLDWGVNPVQWCNVVTSWHPRRGCPLALRDAGAQPGPVRVLATRVGPILGLRPRFGRPRAPSATSRHLRHLMPPPQLTRGDTCVVKWALGLGRGAPERRQASALSPAVRVESPQLPRCRLSEPRWDVLQLKGVGYRLQQVPVGGQIPRPCFSCRPCLR